MIKTLSIQNYALIEHLELDFSKNLTIITGETGAGKSIILGAMGLILGERADLQSLHQKDKKCIIEGHFDIDNYELEDFFEMEDLDFDTQCTIRREISPQGKSRAFINDSPVNLNILRALSEKLIDIHHQFDTQLIGDPLFQMKVLDAMADNKALLKAYRSKFNQYKTRMVVLEQMIAANDSKLQELDFLEFQLDELCSLELNPGEQQALEQEQKTLLHAEKICSYLYNVFNELSESEHPIIDRLKILLNHLNEIASFQSELPPLINQFTNVLFELEDVGQEFCRIAERTELDAERIQEIEQRLDSIYKLNNKYKVLNGDELLNEIEVLQNKIDQINADNEEILMLESEIDELEKDLYKIAAKLSEKRHAQINKLEDQTLIMLQKLSMLHARFKVIITEGDSLNSEGINQVEFLFSANAGIEARAIQKVASGGELSRLALCIKSMVASSIPLPTIVFDEIDAGVSGEVAIQMGNILQSLSENHQLISITHAPQIAAKAHKHFFVHKVVEKDLSKTALRELDEQERILEIAKMLSGDHPTEHAQMNAKELMGIL